MIRPFVYADLNRILQIEQHSFPKSPYPWTAFLHFHYLYPETFLVYVNTIDNQKKGRILGYITYSPDGHIISIAVDPKHRRKGIGKKLLETAICTPHVKKVWAEMRRSNQGAQAFYLKLGFKIVGEVSNYYGDEDALIIERTPPAPGSTETGESPQ
jgi:ribosomal-protein-alanine N-acetyltransferase